MHCPIGFTTDIVAAAVVVRKSNAKCNNSAGFYAALVSFTFSSFLDILKYTYVNGPHIELRRSLVAQHA